MFSRLFPYLQVHKIHILLKGIMPHIFLPLLPLEENQFSVSVVRDLSSKLQPDCVPALFIPICSKASTVFWIKLHFFPVFSIMVMLKQSSFSAFSLLWKTTSSGFHSLDQVSLYPWINLVTFHWIGDALKASLILWRRNGKKYFSVPTRNASPILQTHLPFSMSASPCQSVIWQCVSTPSLTEKFLAHARNSCY